MPTSYQRWGISRALQQMERLYEALKEGQHTAEAKMLRGLINKAETIRAVEPARVELSRASFLRKQELRSNVKVPVDKETGAPLAQLILLKIYMTLKCQSCLMNCLLQSANLLNSGTTWISWHSLA